jgi:hypothetical protein
MSRSGKLRSIAVLVRQLAAGETCLLPLRTAELHNAAWVGHQNWGRQVRE